MLNRYVLPELGHLPIAAITAGQLEQMIGALATAGKRRAVEICTPKRSNAPGTSTRQVFGYAMQHDALTSNPIDRVDFSANRATGDREDFAPIQALCVRAPALLAR